MPSLALAASLVAALAAADAAATWPAVVQRVQAAQQAGDLAGWEAALDEALALRPGYPRVLHNLAAVRTRRGDAAGAFAALDTLAAMGIVTAVEADADFTPLHTDPRWAALIARFKANLAPRPGGSEAFRLDDPRFVPEGLAVDAATGARYVGSVHQRRIVRVTKDGALADFVPAGRDGLMSVLGLALDAKRDLLWANSSALEEMRGYAAADAGRAALYAFALEDGRLVHRFEAPRDAVKMLGDLALGADGTPYASDPLGGAVYSVDPATGAFRRLTAPGALASPQGLAPTADGGALFVADYAQGIVRVALADGTATRLAAPADLCAFGIDGLVRAGDALIAVQNGVRPQRVLRLELAADGARIAAWRALAIADPRWSEPTLGAVVGERFQYVANSQWDRFDANHRLREEPPLAAPLVLELPVR